MLSAILNVCKSFVNRIKVQLKRLTKPTTVAIAAGTLTDLPRTKSDLIIENAMLRQQLIVRKRNVKRPSLTTGDRTRLVLLARLTDFWQSALHIVQPDTLIRWHRDLFRVSCSSWALTWTKTRSRSICARCAVVPIRTGPRSCVITPMKSGLVTLQSSTICFSVPFTSLWSSLTRLVRLSILLSLVTLPMPG
jgi:hypothetical protein